MLKEQVYAKKEKGLGMCIKKLHIETDTILSKPVKSKQPTWLHLYS